MIIGGDAMFTDLLFKMYQRVCPSASVDVMLNYFGVPYQTKRLWQKGKSVPQDYVICAMCKALNCDDLYEEYLIKKKHMNEIHTYKLPSEAELREKFNRYKDEAFSAHIVDYCASKLNLTDEEKGEVDMLHEQGMVEAYMKKHECIK